MTFNEELFQKGREGFEPAPDDNPDAIPFYRDWAGVVAVIGDCNTKKFHHLIHNSLFWANPAHAWKGVLIGLKTVADGMKIPEKPEHRIAWWLVHPDENIEGRAYEMFKSQFKRAFPGKKINSKSAKSEWERLKAKATELAEEEFKAEMIVYQRKLDQVEEENRKAQEEWESKKQAVEVFQKFVSSLEE